LDATAAPAAATLVSTRHSRGAGKALAAVFDLDGLLVDTEPIWRAAHRAVFAELGLDLTVWPTVVTTGMRVDEAVALRRSYLDWGDPPDVVVADAITRRVAEGVAAGVEFCAGALEAIDWCRRRNLPTAVATASTWPVVDAVLGTLDLRGRLDAVVSAEDEDYGKPHPAVYLTAAAKLGVAAASCLVFEDAVNGVIAAKAARMRTVMVPAGTSVGDARVVLADVRLTTLLEVDDGRVAELAGF
jgi:beta-phosphoglucomutase-like phosphatase (HAD superfamily)